MFCFVFLCRKSSSSSVSSGRWSPSASRRRNINRLEVARSHSYHVRHRHVTSRFPVTSHFLEWVSETSAACALYCEPAEIEKLGSIARFRKRFKPKYICKPALWHHVIWPSEFRIICIPSSNSGHLTASGCKTILYFCYIMPATHRWVRSFLPWSQSSRHVNICPILQPDILPRWRYGKNFIRWRYRDINRTIYVPVHPPHVVCFCDWSKTISIYVCSHWTVSRTLHVGHIFWRPLHAQDCRERRRITGMCLINLN